MIISVHIPKSAGTSFRHALENIYGAGLWLNYSDDFTADAIPPNTECIHGHFPADAYSTIFPGHQIVTFVRLPVQRVTSNYYHFLRHHDERNPASRALHAQKLSLIEFARIPSMRNEATRYVAGRRPEDFDLVGITERYEESLLLYQAIFETQVPIPMYRDNVNSARSSEFYDLPADVYSEIEQLNALDLQWYHEACSHFARSIEDFSVGAIV